MLLDYWGLYRERFCNKNGDLVYEFLPSFLGVLDQRCKSDLVSLGIPSEKMFISHNPWLDRVVNETSIIQCDRKLVYDNLAPIKLAFISQPLRMLRSFQNPCPRRVMFEKFMSDLPNDRAFEIQVILHPAENVDHWASLAAQAPNVKISGVAQYNRRKSFFAADATISFNSTLVFEALHLSIPNITLGYEKCFRNSYLNELGLTRVVTNKKEIIDYFRRFNPKKTKETLRAKAMKLRSQELFFSDGSATNRVVDVVTSVCNSQ